MQKIVHLIDCLGVGGAQTHLLTILRCASIERYSHVVYSLTDKLDIANEIEGLGIKVVSLNLGEAFKKKRWITVIRTVSRMLKEERPDILETHLTWSRIIGTIAFIIIGKRRIVSFEQGDIYNVGWKYRIINFLAALFIDVIIVCSSAVKIWIFKNYGIPYSKMAVMHNCVLTDFFKPKDDKSAFKRGLGMGQDEIVIGSVGTFNKGINKGMNYCIDAISILARNYRNIRLIIAGDGELRDVLERQVKDLELTKVVKFLGLRRDVNLILNAIDIFVLASVFEPFGIALIEAMSTERPVVGSASGGIIEIIKDGITGFLVKPCDPQDLARAIEELIKNEELRLRMGKEAREDVKKRFNATSYVKRLEGLYEKLLEAK